MVKPITPPRKATKTVGPTRSVVRPAMSGPSHVVTTAVVAHTKEVRLYTKFYMPADNLMVISAIGGDASGILSYMLRAKEDVERDLNARINLVKMNAATIANELGMIIHCQGDRVALQQYAAKLAVYEQQPLVGETYTTVDTYDLTVIAKDMPDVLPPLAHKAKSDGMSMVSIGGTIQEAYKVHDRLAKKWGPTAKVALLRIRYEVPATWRKTTDEYEAELRQLSVTLGQPEWLVHMEKRDAGATPHAPSLTDMLVPQWAE